MLITWLCLLLMSYSLCQVNCRTKTKPGEVKIPTGYKAKAKLFYTHLKNNLKKGSSYVKRFMIWMWKHMKYGIQCKPIENDSMISCRTKGGLKKVVTEKNWYRTPKIIRRMLVKKTPEIAKYMIV